MCNQQDVDMASEHIERLREISAQLPNVEAELDHIKQEIVELRLVLDGLPTAVIAADADGKITFFNAEAQLMFRLTEGEAMGSSLTLLMPERYRHAHLDAMKRLRDENSEGLIVRTLEGHGMRPDGAEFPVRIRLVAKHRGDRLAFTAAITEIRDGG